eukprot:COSAG06_NODE_13950_length_1202_cov_2.407978_2_plen_160_part_00
MSRQRRYLARARAGPSGKGGKKRTSHSLAESILRSSEEIKGGSGNAAASYTLELGPWPTGETDWPGGASNGWEEERAAAVVGGVPGRLKLGAASGPAAAATAANQGATLGPVSVLAQGNLDKVMGTYWKVAATHLALEVLDGNWVDALGWTPAARLVDI